MHNVSHTDIAISYGAPDDGADAWDEAAVLARPQFSFFAKVSAELLATAGDDAAVAYVGRADISPRRLAAAARPRRKNPPTTRGGAAAGDANSPWRRGAATGRDADSPRRRVAATPRLVTWIFRGEESRRRCGRDADKSLETSRGDGP